MSPFLQQILNTTPALKKARQLSSPVAPTPVTSFTPPTSPGDNPFMIALNPDNTNYQEYYGVNRPLKKPMFLGYRGNQSLYGGSKLFILY